MISDDENELISLFEILGPIARVNYEEICQLIIKRVECIISGQVKTVNSKNNNSNLEELYLKIALNFYLIGAFINTRPPLYNYDECDKVDGGNYFSYEDLICLVLRMSNNMKGGNSNEMVDSALIYFFQAFRKSYIGIIYL